MDVVLSNNEPVAYSYKISVPASIAEDVQIQPTQGIVPACGRTSLLVTCRPRQEQRTSATVSVQVAKKSMPLQLNVKYECHRAKYTLELLPEDDTGAA